MLKIIRAKMHGLHVTGCDLDYHGSITLDPEQCALAGIYPLEFVSIWNKNSGARIETYVLFGESGSRCCILNGAAARTCQKGDEVIICASEYIASPAELEGKAPTVLTFNRDNTIKEVLEYCVSGNASAGFDFSIIEK